MIRDLELLSTSAPDHSEICVVGAGGAGILLAVKLANAGRKVTLLEGGGLFLESSSQSLYQSQVIGLPHHGIHNGRFRTYGGTTTEWGGQILELDDFDFAYRPHVPGSGWPLTKSELRDYYDQATQCEGLTQSLSGDVDGRKSLLKKLKMRDLSLGHEFILPFSRWCPERNFAVLHKKTLEEAPNLSVYLHGNVVEIVLNKQSTAICSLRVRTFNGREFHISADRFVLCMGGIETTRLLLQPTDNGPLPWQKNGVLGKYYQDHISCDCISIHNIAAKPIWRYFGFVRADGFQYQTKIQLAFREQSQHKTLNVAASINPYERWSTSRDMAVRVLRRVRDRRGKVRFIEFLRASAHLPSIVYNWLILRIFGGSPAWRRTMLRIHCEQSPCSQSTISLSDTRDAFGMLRTRIDWHISSHEIESIRTYVRLAEQHFREKNFATVEPPPGFFTDDSVVLALCSDSNHHMGTTRMSLSPNEGIVDPDLRLHGIANGYICSASVFPSSGFSNPTHTLLALALRLADNLIANPPFRPKPTGGGY